MSVNIHIENVRIGHEAAQTLMAEQARGVTPDNLRDIGYAVAEGAPEVLPPDQLSLDDEMSRLESLAETTRPIGDNVKPFTRRAHLAKAIQTAGKLRKIRGGVTTSQETSINDMDLAENALEGYSGRFGDSLAKACGACAFKDTCRLVDNPEAWLRTHPTKKNQVTNKRQESIPDFQARLDKDPMAHCVPPSVPREKITLQ